MLWIPHSSLPLDRHFRGKMPKKHRVPVVLWRLFRDRARTLGETIVSLLPRPSPSVEQCRCKGQHCLGCSKDAMSFLLRPGDPRDYCKLLTQCFIVVSENAPLRSVFIPHCRWSQSQIVKRTIELILCERDPVSSNVLCAGYDKGNCSSPTVELLSSSSWDLLLSRAGDDFMVYLLRFTSIFLSVPREKHYQVAGPPISSLCFKMSKSSSKFDLKHPSLCQYGAQKKRKRLNDVYSTVEKQKQCVSFPANGPVGFSGSLDLTGVKSSRSEIRHHGSIHHQVDSKGKQGLKYFKARLGKCSTPFSWQWGRKQRQLSAEENSVKMNYNMLHTNKDYLPGRTQCNENSLSHQEKKCRVPVVLRHLFGDQVCTLAETIESLLPRPPPSAEQCRCKGRHCLGCSKDAMSFLLRPEDPRDYHKLLTRCFIVVSENAPLRSVFIPHCRWSQSQIVRRTIELLLCEKEPVSSNVLCANYDKGNCSSPTVELLSCSSWGLLLSRVGDDLMVYLLRYTSIFLSVPHENCYQVAGPPVSSLRFKMSKHSSKFGQKHPSLYLCGSQKKRKRSNDVNSTAEKQNQCVVSFSANGPSGFPSSLDLTSMKSSRPLIRHHRSIHHQVDSKGKQGSNYITARLGKRSRPFSWQRSRKRRQLSAEENSVNRDYNMLHTNADCLPGSTQCNETSLSHQEKMLGQCSCCLILQCLPTVPKKTEIKRQPIFYNLVSSPSVFPKNHILSSLRPNFAGSKYLVGNIFGISDVNGRAQSMPCFHNSVSCLTGSACLYHSLVKWFKHLIRRTQCCQHRKLLDKHCVVPSWDQYKIGRSNSTHQGNVSEPSVQEKPGFESKYCADTVEAIDSHYQLVKAYCSRSQVVSFIWAVSRSILPPELLGTPSNWRIMRRNISKFIHLRRFEKFPLKLCIHELKTSRFPFLSNKYFLNGQNAQVLKYIDGHNGIHHEDFKNWSSAVHVIKQKLLERWMFWYFSCLIVPLVQSNFYVTESEHGQQDVYYYRKPVWEKLTNSTIACLKDQRYSYLDNVAVRNILRGRSFGFSKLRLRPRENGVRMVANMKGSSKLPACVPSKEVQPCKKQRKANPQKIIFNHYQSVNSILRDAHTILKGLRLKESEMLGSSVFDYNDVYRKLCPFLIGQKKGLTAMPKFFIVISDVLKAFDSVDQEKLLCVMKEVLLKDEYVLKQYEEVVCTKKSLRVCKQLRLFNENISTGYTRFTSSAPFRSLHSVFVNQEQVKHVEKKVLFSQLEQHVKHNVLQLDGKFYLQGVGIPQGGVLSTLLCSFYYGHLERHVIFPFLEKSLESGGCKEIHDVHSSSVDGVSSPCYTLIRWIDDILFISTSKKQAASFFSRLQRGFRDYNCYMNEKKFGINFDIGQMSGSSSSRVYVGEDGTTFLRWSGLFINCCTLEIQADYTKYLNNHLSSTLTICWQGKQGLSLEDKLCGFLRPKCHPIFFDSNINSAAVVRLNIYQAFLLCAMKFHCYICDLSYICKLHVRYCLVSIERSLSYMRMLIKKRMDSMCVGSDFRPILQLEEGEVEWLGFHAYVQVLNRKASRHKKLLSVLRSRLLSHRISDCTSAELKHAINPSNSSLLWNIKY